MTKLIQIIDTGVANICSLQAAFERLDCRWNLTRDADTIRNAENVLLPGVGAFAAAMSAIERDGLRAPIVDRIASDQRTLAICLGLQLFCQSSEESPGVEGLGILPYQVKRFSSEVQTPQLGWNDVTPESEAPFAAGSAYFANSFRLVDRPAGWNFATTTYDGEFVSSFWRSNVLACQFHPELSGSWGQQLLSCWLEGALC